MEEKRLLVTQHVFQESLWKRSGTLVPADGMKPSTLCAWLQNPTGVFHR